MLSNKATIAKENNHRGNASETVSDSSVARIFIHLNQFVIFK